VAQEDSHVSGIAKRYATALFDLAEEAGALDAVNADLKSLRQAIETSADLARFVRSPVISREEHGKAMGAILDKMGVQALTKNFVALVAANRRLFALVDMVKAYGHLLAAKRGEITAKVTSAHALSEPQLEKLKATLKAKLGQDVAVDAMVDPEILGGLVVKVGSRMIDGSLRTKLQTLQIAMKEAG